MSPVSPVPAQAVAGPVRRLFLREGLLTAEAQRRKFFISWTRSLQAIKKSRNPGLLWTRSRAETRSPKQVISGQMLAGPCRRPPLTRPAGAEAPGPRGPRPRSRSGLVWLSGPAGCGGHRPSTGRRRVGRVLVDRARGAGASQRAPHVNGERFL